MSMEKTPQMISAKLLGSDTSILYRMLKLADEQQDFFVTEPQLPPPTQQQRQENENKLLD